MREGLVVEFDRADGSTWIANFDDHGWGLDQVLVHPNGHDVLVLAGGSVWCVDPTTERTTKLAPFVVEMWKLENPPRVLFNNQGLWFMCVAPGGVAWTTRRISWDGFQHIRLTDTAPGWGGMVTD